MTLHSTAVLLLQVRDIIEAADEEGRSLTEDEIGNVTQ